MNCPVCNIALVMTDRQGVEIDHCPRCRGVWLDRGELDKIIERSKAFVGDSGPDAGRPTVGLGQPDRDRRRDDDDDNDDRRRYSRDDDRGGNYQKRRKSFWEELFD